MKVTFNTEELQRRLGQLGGVVAKKASLEAFKYVRLYTEPSPTAPGTFAIKLLGMDIDATLTVTLAQAQADGAVDVLLPYGKLAAIVNAITAKETSVELMDETRAVIRAGRLRAGELDTYPLSSLPSFLEPPTSSKAVIGLPGLQSQIANIIYAVPEQNGKFTVSVAKLESTATELALIATDGFRLVISKVPQQLGEFALTLPKTALEKIARLEGGASGNLTLAEVEAGFFFYTDSEVLTVNRTAGEFPPYQRIIPSGDPASTIIVESTKELLSIINQTKPLADNEKPVLTFSIKDGVLAAEAATRKQATASPDTAMRFVGQADMDVKVTGGDVDFSLDVNMLLPFLEKVQDTPVVIKVKNNTSIVDFHGANEQVRFLQMPTNPTTRS
jgi:DNA polymerase III subunit beta